MKIKLRTPTEIQRFLDDLDYSTDSFYRSPAEVLRDKKAHCFDGALFGAAALRRIGDPPLLVDLRAVRDDDHVLAIYKRRDLYGAVSKSNFVGLRFREPIFRSIRELALSYFESYFNTAGEKTLREYSIPLNLAAFDRQQWMMARNGLDQIADKLDAIRHYPILPAAAIRGLSKVDPRSLKAGLVGANAKGLYKP